MVLTIAEKSEIISIARNASYRRTAEIFNRRHPNRERPLSFVTVSKIFVQLRTRGNLNRKRRTKSAISTAHNALLKEEVVQTFRDDPHLSTRRAAARFRKSQWKIWSILKDSKFYPYKMSKHQVLNPEDLPVRKEYCERLLQIFDEDANFYKRILWSDEKLFRVNGCFNRQNFRYVQKKLIEL